MQGDTDIRIQSSIAYIARVPKEQRSFGRGQTMSLLAESLVEEWLNRKGFFTIRGIKHGVGELDLVGIRRESNGSVMGWHVEVQVSFRPIGYMTRITREMARAAGRAGGFAKHRTPDEIEACVREWVNDKFTSKKKQEVRESLWPGVDWQFHLVHGVARWPEELEAFKKKSYLSPLQRITW